VREEQAPSQPTMRFLARKPLESLQQVFINQFRRPFSRQCQLVIPIVRMK
jgi:hypothetical protein